MFKKTKINEKLSHHVDDLIVSSLADLLLIEGELCKKLVPLAAADEGRCIHDATVANDETVLNQILVLKPRSGYRNSAATSD